MNKIIFTLLVLLSSLYASVTNQYLEQKLIDNKTPIVDIRTPGEWIETGLVKGAIPIMFFNEKGQFNIQGFLDELNKKVDTTKPFALICRTGSRTRMVAEFLSTKLNYKVINLQGGILYAKSKNLPILPYK